MLQQQKHGLFPRIVGKGDNAKRLADLLLRMRNEVVAGESSNGSSPFLGPAPSSSIDSLIIIDREVDFPTVLLSQLTYEGLIDEVFGIQANQTEVDSSIVGTAAPPKQGTAGSAPTSMKRKVLLDVKDSLYSTLGDSNFAVVGNLLNKVARRLQNSTQRDQLAAKSTAELRDFVAKLPGYQAEQSSLKLHTSLAEEIIKHTRGEIFTRCLEVQQNLMSGADPATQHDSLDELISRAIPLPTVLRLLCLESTTNAGIKPKDLDAFKRSIIAAYGPQHLLTLSALEKMSLLQPRGGGSGGSLGMSAPAAKPGSVSNYPALRKAVRLWDDEVNEASPNDVSYVFSGYAPLSVRLVQAVMQKHVLANIVKPPPASAQSTPSASATSATLSSPAQQQQQSAHSPAPPSNPLAQGLRLFDDAVRHVRGATVDAVQTGEEQAVRARQVLNGHSGDAAAATAVAASAAGAPLTLRKASKTVVVFFLGGVTRAEIAALRFIGGKLGGPAPADARLAPRIVVCTTGIVNGDGLVGAAIEERSFAAGTD